MERPAVGTDYPEYNMAMEDMRYDLGYALPENYAGGGIAGLSVVKRFGRAPCFRTRPLRRRLGFFNLIYATKRTEIIYGRYRKRTPEY